MQIFPCLMSNFTEFSPCFKWTAWKSSQLSLSHESIIKIIGICFSGRINNRFTSCFCFSWPSCFVRCVHCAQNKTKCWCSCRTGETFFFLHNFPLTCCSFSVLSTGYISHRTGSTRVPRVHKPPGVEDLSVISPTCSRVLPSAHPGRLGNAQRFEWKKLLLQPHDSREDLETTPLTRQRGQSRGHVQHWRHGGNKQLEKCTLKNPCWSTVLNISWFHMSLC